MKKLKVLSSIVMVIVLCLSLAVPAFAAGEADVTASFTTVVKPVVTLLNSLIKPLLSIVVAVGSLYCVILGVKYAKAEEPQDREKAKQHLKNAIIGFFLIFVLILALNILWNPLINWVNANANGVTGTIIK